MENSNDSYWLPSARFRLTGFPRIIGPEGTRLLRTRLGLLQAEQRLAGTDGLGPAGFTIDTMKAVFNANRNLSGELARDAVVQPAPRAAADWRGVPGAGGLGRARRHRLARRGAVARGVVAVVVSAGVPWTVPFDPADPVNTPRGLDASDPKVTDALRGAVEDLRAKGIALDVPGVGDKQAEPRGAERIGIPGCTEGEAASTSSRPAVTSRATMTRSPARRS